MESLFSMLFLKIKKIHLDQKHYQGMKCCCNKQDFIQLNKNQVQVKRQQNQ
ncbi:unnamed protein product [Paramecium sonneborni]|uniref:Uncharacterized protein n=1 Tax=Paramecium sonneborni TaxID=65129 RepID=A0A8S1RFQ6_9CILI|nr:unnamed protein product [Paramecium sonneborni]